METLEDTEEIKLVCWECRNMVPAKDRIKVCAICYRNDCPNIQDPNAVKICPNCHSKVDYTD